MALREWLVYVFVSPASLDIFDTIVRIVLIPMGTFTSHGLSGSEETCQWAEVKGLWIFWQFGEIKIQNFYQTLESQAALYFDTLVFGMYILKPVLVVFGDEFVIFIVHTAIINAGVRGAVAKLINMQFPLFLAPSEAKMQANIEKHQIQ